MMNFGPTRESRAGREGGGGNATSASGGNKKYRHGKIVAGFMPKLCSAQLQFTGKFRLQRRVYQKPHQNCGSPGLKRQVPGLF